MNIIAALRMIMMVRNERGELTSDRFRLMARRRMRRLLESGEIESILDAGGGAGLLFDPGVRELKANVVVLDNDTGELSKGKRAYSRFASDREIAGGQFICGDIVNMPFRDAAFDSAVCIGTFYNFPGEDEIIAGLRELARVTCHDGAVFSEFRNAANPLVRALYRHASSYDASLGRLPLRAYREDEIRRFHSAAGLEIESFTSLGLPGRLLSFGFIVRSRKK